MNAIELKEFFEKVQERDKELIYGSILSIKKLDSRNQALRGA